MTLSKPRGRLLGIVVTNPNFSCCYFNFNLFSHLNFRGWSCSVSAIHCRWKMKGLFCKTSSSFPLWNPFFRFPFFFLSTYIYPFLSTSHTKGKKNKKESNHPGGNSDVWVLFLIFLELLLLIFKILFGRSISEWIFSLNTWDKNWVSS